MAKIDSQMLQLHQRYTQGSSDQGKKISETEALQFIRRAEEINDSTSSSYKSESRRGNKYLLTLMKEHDSDFSQEGKRAIQKYIQSGQIPVISGRTGNSSMPGPSSTSSSNMPVSGRPNASITGNSPSRPTTSGIVTNRPNDPISISRPNNPVPVVNSSTGVSGVNSTRPSNPLPSVNPGSGVSGVNPFRPTNPVSGMNPSTGINPSMPTNPISGGTSGTGGLNPSVPSNPISGVRPGTGGLNPSVPSNPVSGVTPGTGGLNPSVPSTPVSGITPGTGGLNPSVPSTPVSGVTPGTGTGGLNPNPPTNPVSGVTPGTGTGTVTTPTAPTFGNDTGVVGPHGTVILDFHANKRTWGCHWFPQQETRPGGDPVNNLYAKGGPLDKLDMVTGGQACNYEYNHNRKAVDAGESYHWWGHCNNASEAACLLQSPKHGVVMTGKNGEQVKFTRGDIQGLLVKVTPCLVNKVDFKGERFNNPGRDNPNDPAPELFLSVMQEWAKDGMPFVLDIDRTGQVWNFPYDQVKISESDKSPAGFSATGLSGDGAVKYYHVEMSGTEFNDKKRTYECYVQRNSSGNVIASGWIKTPNTHNNPDFMWRPHPVGDLMDKKNWQVRGRPSNPEVDPQVVYDIYMKSLA